jgi:IS5 family transposase
MGQKGNRQRSFFDELYEKAVPEDHFLRRLDELIRWERLEKRLRGFYREQGRDAHNAVMMFKLLTLQFLYDLSDRELEEAARDRISFRWFCRIDPLGAPPDYSAFSRFRDRIGPDKIKELFDEVVNEAAHEGFVLDKLSLVDATAVKAKVDIYKLKKPKGDGDSMGGAGQGPGGPDPDARWGKKSEKKPFFGYKAHAAVDDGSELITQIEVSPGDVHDGSFFPEVHDPYAEGVTADKAYDSAENFELIRSSGQLPALIPKRKRGQKRGHVSGRYDDFERGYYYRMKKRRPRVEHKFAEGKKYHGLGVARYWGLAKVRVQVFMTALALNLKRLVRLKWGEARWELA